VYQYKLLVQLYTNELHAPSIAQTDHGRIP
jgi:hypothetical protein